MPRVKYCKAYYSSIRTVYMWYERRRIEILHMNASFRIISHKFEKKRKSKISNFKNTEKRGFWKYNILFPYQVLRYSILTYLYSSFFLYIYMDRIILKWLLLFLKSETFGGFFLSGSSFLNYFPSPWINMDIIFVRLQRRNLNSSRCYIGSDSCVRSATSSANHRGLKRKRKRREKGYGNRRSKRSLSSSCFSKLDSSTCTRRLAYHYLFFLII